MHGQSGLSQGLDTACLGDASWNREVQPMARLKVSGRAIVAAGVAVAMTGAVVAARRRRPRDPATTPEPGVFPGGMAYCRLGTGPRTVLFIPGGPGNLAPGATTMHWTMSYNRPFLDAGYTLWSVTRRRGMPVGHTMADIADDYAELIRTEFDGRVDIVVGTSYGGMVALYLAARHPACFGTMAVVAAAARLTEEGAAADRAFARHLSEGRPGEAIATLAPFVAPDIPRPLARVFGSIIGPRMFRDTHPTFASDVLVEAEAEASADATDILPTISVPVLLINGDRDGYFPLATIEETARLIPDCIQKRYEGKGHVRVAGDPQVARDVLDFVAAR